MNGEFNGLMMHIYPLGMTGAPRTQDHTTVHRLKMTQSWIPHWQKLGVESVYFGPVFESGIHGYDPHDYRRVDPRLGTKDDLKELIETLHEGGIKVIFDAVFNHVGRGFPQFQDVLEKREGSEYKDSFFVDFAGNNSYNDGLRYESWEGHEELVQLNLQNEAVVNFHLENVRYWIEVFDIDGLRLDVAYMLDRDFLRRLRHETDVLKEDFLLFGEMIHGDYCSIVSDELLHSATNYEAYKGIYSSLNDRNLFEIAHSMVRQFGPEDWTRYRGLELVTFTDNHDVSRLASILHDPSLLPLAYGILFTIPGIPCLYYGSEWGIEGRKEEGDWALRPEIDAPKWNELTSRIRDYADLRRNSAALRHGDFRNIEIRNTAWIFSRKYEEETVYVGINLEDEPMTLALHEDVQGEEVYSEEAHGEKSPGEPYRGHELEIPPKGIRVIRSSS